MSALEEALAAIQVIVSETGLFKETPALPPESATGYPFSVVYPRSGTIEKVADYPKRIHRIYLEVHVSRTLLPSAVALALTCMEAVENGLLADPNLGGRISTIDFPLTYTFGALRWGNVDTVGVRYEVPIKMKPS